MFADGERVLTRYPVDPTIGMESWPWVAGTILGPGLVNPGEWFVRINREDLATAGPNGEVIYPACYSMAEDIRPASDDEWNRHRR